MKAKSIIGVLISIVISVIAFIMGNQNATTEQIVQEAIKQIDTVVLHDSRVDTVFRNKYIKSKPIIKYIIKEVTKYTEKPVSNNEEIISYTFKKHLVNVTVFHRHEGDTIKDVYVECHNDTIN